MRKASITSAMLASIAGLFGAAAAANAPHIPLTSYSSFSRGGVGGSTRSPNTVRPGRNASFRRKAAKLRRVRAARG